MRVARTRAQTQRGCEIFHLLVRQNAAPASDDNICACRAPKHLDPIPLFVPFLTLNFAKSPQIIILTPLCPSRDSSMPLVKHMCFPIRYSHAPMIDEIISGRKSAGAACVWSFWLWLLASGGSTVHCSQDLKCTHCLFQNDSRNMPNSLPRCSSKFCACQTTPQRHVGICQKRRVLPAACDATEAALIVVVSVNPHCRRCTCVSNFPSASWCASFFRCCGSKTTFRKKKHDRLRTLRISLQSCALARLVTCVLAQTFERYMSVHDVC